MYIEVARRRRYHLCFDAPPLEVASRSFWPRYAESSLLQRRRGLPPYLASGRQTSLGVLLGILLLLPTPCSATSVAKVEMRQLVEQSSSIVHGTVASTRSHWNDDHTLIVTDVHVRVTAALKGQPGNEIVVTQPGGVVGKLQVEIPGASPFRTGEETILFVAPGSGGRLYVTGLSQGRLEIVMDTQTGHKVVRGISTEGRGTLLRAGHRPTLSAAAGSAVELGGFLNDLRALVHDVEREPGK